MSTHRPHPRLLLVEGADELRVIPQLVEKAGIPWGGRNEPDRWPAKIVDFDGVENMLLPGEIGAQLNSPGLVALGIVADADNDAAGRWADIRRQAEPAFGPLPEDLPAGGLVISNAAGLRFGVWLMPDCGPPGMLETFLATCVPDPTGGLWPFVVAHCDTAKSDHSAPYLVAHIDKARIHAWLALQDPPGQQLHAAVMQNILRPGSPEADRFVRWFRDLFQV